LTKAELDEKHSDKRNQKSFHLSKLDNNNGERGTEITFY